MKRTKFFGCFIHQFHNLEGVKLSKGKTVSGINIKESSNIEFIISHGYLVTAAADNGAFNIWKDDLGYIRCEAMRWCNRVDMQIHESYEPVIKWADFWLKAIR